MNLRFKKSSAIHVHGSLTFVFSLNLSSIQSMSSASVPGSEPEQEEVGEIFASKQARGEDRRINENGEDVSAWVSHTSAIFQINL